MTNQCSTCTTGPDALTTPRRPGPSRQPGRGAATLAIDLRAQPLPRWRRRLDPPPRQVPILPSISVITPTYNQARFIGQTVDSVREQGYPELEHIVVDGLSTDDTLEVLRPYGEALTVISEADSGQTEAINKGLKRASNDVICWLNSDDYLLPGALRAVGEFFAAHPDVMWVTGDGVIVDAEGRPIQSAVRTYKQVLRRFGPSVYLGLANAVVQPATFWRREVHDQLGFLDESLHYTMDYDWWLRLLRLGRPGRIDQALCGFRIHDASKSGALFEKMLAEDYQTYRKHSRSPVGAAAHRAHNALVLAAYRRIK